MGSASASLTDLATSTWQELSNASQQPEHAWRFPVLSTFNNGQPDSRILVLRQVDTTELTFRCHTDLRSSKVDQLREQPAVSWLFYDPVQRIQLRVQGTVSLHRNDTIANQLWSTSDPASLKLYLGPETPGTTVKSPRSNLPDALKNRPPTKEECLPGRPWFCVVQTRVLSIDWMKLRHEGNLRALFDWSSGELQADWLVP